MRAVMQHHDAGVAAVDAIEHPDVNGIESVADAIRSAGAAGGAAASLIGVITDVEGDAGQLRRAAFEMKLLALLPALERSVTLSILNSGCEIRIVVVARRR